VKNIVLLPVEILPVKRTLEAAYETAIADVAGGNRLEYNAGRLSMLSELIDSLEQQYLQMQRQPEIVNG